MAASYVGTAIWHETLQLPAPGDGATAASVNAAGFQYLADNLAFLDARTRVLVNGGLVPAKSIVLGGNLTVPSGSAVIGIDAMIHRNAYIDGAAYIQKTLHVGSGFNALGSGGFGGGVNIAAGGIRMPAGAMLGTAIGPDSSGFAWLGNEANFINVPNLTLNPSTYLIDQANYCPVGAWIVFTRPGANVLALNGPAGTIASISNQWCLIVKAAAGWYMAAKGSI